MAFRKTTGLIDSVLAIGIVALILWVVFKVLSGDWNSSKGGNGDDGGSAWPDALSGLENLGRAYRTWVSGPGGVDENVRNFPNYVFGSKEDQDFANDPTPWSYAQPLTPTPDQVQQVDAAVNQFETEAPNFDATNWFLSNRLF